eukprot:756511-Hanusia_phi.AAC.2
MLARLCTEAKKLGKERIPSSSSPSSSSSSSSVIAGAEERDADKARHAAPRRDEQRSAGNREDGDGGGGSASCYEGEAKADDVSSADSKVDFLQGKPVEEEEGGVARSLPYCNQTLKIPVEACFHTIPEDRFLAPNVSWRWRGREGGRQEQVGQALHEDAAYFTSECLHHKTSLSTRMLLLSTRHPR